MDDRTEEASDGHAERQRMWMELVRHYQAGRMFEAQTVFNKLRAMDGREPDEPAR